VSLWLYTSDLHGQSHLYEQVMALAASRRPAVVAIGGDLAPHAMGVEGLRQQRIFFRGFFVEFARRLREAVPGLELVVLMGNDDWRANMDALSEQEGVLWRVAHERAVRLDGQWVCGLSWVPITPFSLKDWELWDDEHSETAGRLDGWRSEGEALHPFRFDPARRTPTLEHVLDQLAGASPPAETLYILHSPPHETRCDVIGGGTHVGSRAIRRFIERHRPPLVLSGHIHESPRVSSSYRDAIGPSIVVNPGQFGTSRLCGVWFDPGDIQGTLKHTAWD
jgi:Icc-related predicted phosphoesterase